MSDYIPKELLTEILLRLPIASLLRFTCVCKSWCALITNPSFITKHLNHTKQTNDDKLVLRFQSYNDRKYHYRLCRDCDQFYDQFTELGSPIIPKKGSVRIVGSCNGLLCLCNDADRFLDTPVIVLWNPTVRKSVTLPMPSDPMGPMFVLGFGAHPTTQEFRVISLVYGPDPLYGRVPVMLALYTHCSRTWRGISSATPPHWIMPGGWSPVFLNGCVHWLANDQSVVSGSRNLIASFDMGAEACSEIMLPPNLPRRSCLSIKKYGESLAVICNQMVKDSCSIWVMKEYGVAESWTKLFTINTMEILYKVLGFRRNGVVLVENSKNLLLSYDPGTRTMTDTGIRGTFETSYVVDFLETLLLVKENVKCTYENKKRKCEVLS